MFLAGLKSHRWQTALCRVGCMGYRNIYSKHPFLKISDEVRDALESMKPVVALETTIYTHGFPYPENIALSIQLESIVRQNGGIPATIGVLNGIARVGFESEELIELLESAGRPDTIKVSRRDLSYICGSVTIPTCYEVNYDTCHAYVRQSTKSRKTNGATTIAGTMVLAHLAGIRVFATGGLGGVHKGGEKTMDISADLTELGRTPVALISSGCKSFLDIPRTLEYLETQGVGVGTFADGRKGKVDFPAFWTRDSGIQSPTVIEDEKQAAAIIHAQTSLRLSSGLLFANPINVQDSLPREYMDQVMSQAIQDASERGISGSANTPFILSRIREITKGSTVTANKALVEANVKRGTKVAAELALLDSEYQGPLTADSKTFEKPRNINSDPAVTNQVPCGSVELKDISVNPDLLSTSKATVVVCGSIAIDLSCDYNPGGSYGNTPAIPASRTSNPASIMQSLGGVGQNVATALHYLSTAVHLCSAVGDDLAGKTALKTLLDRGMQVDDIEIIKEGARTAQYVATNDADKNLVIAMADMDILERQMDDFASRWMPHLAKYQPQWLVVDANWDPETLRRWILAAKAGGIKVAYEPVSAEKSTRIYGHESPDEGSAPGLVDLATPNSVELCAMYQRFQISASGLSIAWSRMIDVICSETQPDLTHIPLFLRLQNLCDQLGTDLPRQALKMLISIPCILTKLGPRGVLLTELLPIGDPRLPPGMKNLKTEFEAYSHWNHHTMQLNASDFAALELYLEGIGGISMQLFPPAENAPPDRIVSVNGVGDTFLGIIMAGLSKDRPRTVNELVDIAQRGAVMTLKCRESVSPQISNLAAEL